jgi:hypothetical protein
MNSLTTNITYEQDSLRCQLISDFDVFKHERELSTFFENKNVQCEVSFLVDLNLSQIHINPSHVKIEAADFNINGNFNYGFQGAFNLDIAGSDREMSFYQLILQEDIINKNMANLDKGNIYFKGKIAGRMSEDFIFADIGFGVEDLRIEIADDVEPIDQLNFKGRFTTGGLPDYSQAMMKINNLSANLPDGHIAGNFTLENYQKPQVSLMLDGKVNLENLSRVFKIDERLDELSGTISITSNLSGYFDREKGRVIRQQENSEILLDSITFRLPSSAYNVDLLDGKITRTKEDYLLENLKFKRNKTDLTINGHLSKILAIVFKEKTDITADLTIESEQLIIKELIGKDAHQSKILNDTLSNIRLVADIHTSATSLLNIEKFPASRIDIRELQVQLQTTPDISTGKGTLIYTDDPDKFNIGFDNINLQTSVGEILVSGDLQISDTLNQFIDFTTSTQELKISQAKDQLKLINLDYSILDSLNGLFSSEFDLLFLFSPDSFQLNQFSLKNFDFEYVHNITTDNSIMKDINFSIDNIKYDAMTKKINVYQGLVSFGRINTAWLKTKDISFEFNRNHYVYQVHPDLENILGGGDVIEDGNLWIDVSDSIPSYRLEYKIQNYQIGNVMKSLDKANILEGPMSVDLKLSTRGRNLDELMINLVGRAQSEGKNLFLYGIDLDHILDKIQRFQSFNLVDVSAFFIAGPFAPLATKGYDAANMITTSYGDTTHVTRLVSNWRIEKGSATIMDAALATDKNRVAVTGQLNVVKGEFVNITVAVLNRRGCSLISQELNGPFSDPTLSNMKAVGPIRGTLQSLVNIISGSECEPFYTGILPHPN